MTFPRSGKILSNENVQTTKGDCMISKDLLDILRCPVCVREKGKEGNLILYKDTWLLCQDCDRKYPIVEDIPVMLIDEGDKWSTKKKEDLPVPPPRPD